MFQPNQTGLENRNRISGKKLSLIEETILTPQLISASFNSLQLDDWQIRIKILANLMFEVAQFENSPQKRFEGVSDQVKLYVSKENVFKLLKSFFLTNNITESDVDFLWNSFGTLSIDVLSPAQFFQNAFRPVGKMRRKRFYDDYGWQTPLVEGLDLSAQDLFSYHGMINTQFGVIASVRDVFSSIPRTENIVEILESQENTAFQTLIDSKAKGQQSYDLIHEILVSNKYPEIIEAVKLGALGSIERFTTLSKQDYLSRFPEDLLRYRHYVNTVGMLLVFALLAATSLRNGRRYSIAQVNPQFMRLLGILLGINKGIFNLSTSMQYKRNKDGELVEDPCITTLVDFEGCLEYTSENFVELYNLTNDFLRQLYDSNSIMVIDRSWEHATITDEQ